MTPPDRSELDRHVRPVRSGPFVTWVVGLLIVSGVLGCRPERFHDPEPVMVLDWDDLEHRLGRPVDDPEAESGVAWEVHNRILQVELPPAQGEPPREIRFRVKSANPEGPFPRAKAWARWGAADSEQTELWIVTEFLNPPGVYRDAVLQLDPPPGAAVRFGIDLQLSGYHQFWIDTVTVLDGSKRVIETFEAESTDGWVGLTLPDPDASGGSARTDDHTLAFGPYQPLGPPGRYLAIFRLQAARGLPPGLLGSVDVWAHDGRWDDGTIREKFYARQDLDGADFLAKGSYEEFPYVFDYDGAELVECRVFAYSFIPGVLRLDRIEIYRLS